MSFIRRLFGRGGGGGKDEGIYFYVRCDRCGRVLHTRLDPQRELTPREEGGYRVRKELMDDRCFRPFFLEALFDPHKGLLQAQVEGGTLIDREQWEAEKGLPRRGGAP